MMLYKAVSRQRQQRVAKRRMASWLGWRSLTGHNRAFRDGIVVPQSRHSPPLTMG